MSLNSMLTILAIFTIYWMNWMTVLTLAQATSQLEDGTPLAPAQPDGTKAQERTAKGLKGQAGTQEEAETHRG
jgi:hypothetical protein